MKRLSLALLVASLSTAAQALPRDYTEIARAAFRAADDAEALAARRDDQLVSQASNRLHYCLSDLYRAGRDGQSGRADDRRIDQLYGECDRDFQDLRGNWLRSSFHTVESERLYNGIEYSLHRLDTLIRGPI